MDSPFMNTIAEGLAEAAIHVIRFEFPYMAARRHGQRKGPDRAERLLESWRSVLERFAPRGQLFIGGKSLGGRMATMIATSTSVEGVVCFGYPFHPPGRPETLRTAHLEQIDVPVLILQGERDPFGTPAETARYELSPTVTIAWIPDGDHSFKPRKKSGHSLDSNLDLALERAIRFIQDPTLR